MISSCLRASTNLLQHRHVCVCVRDITHLITNPHHGSPLATTSSDPSPTPVGAVSVRGQRRTSEGRRSFGSSRLFPAASWSGSPAPVDQLDAWEQRSRCQAITAFVSDGDGPPPVCWRRPGNSQPARRLRPLSRTSMSNTTIPRTKLRAGLHHGLHLPL